MPLHIAALRVTLHGVALRMVLGLRHCAALRVMRRLHRVGRLMVRRLARLRVLILMRRRSFVLLRLALHLRVGFALRLRLLCICCCLGLLCICCCLGLLCICDCGLFCIEFLFCDALFCVVGALFALPFWFVLLFFCAFCLSAVVTGAKSFGLFGSLKGLSDAVSDGLPLLTDASWLRSSPAMRAVFF